MFEACLSYLFLPHLASQLSCKAKPFPDKGIPDIGTLPPPPPGEYFLVIGQCPIFTAGLTAFSLEFLEWDSTCSGFGASENSGGLGFKNGKIFTSLSLTKMCQFTSG